MTGESREPKPMQYRSRSRSRRGAVMVEAAIVLSVFLTLILGCST
jgi:Flp pilus assembly protein TadG